MTGNGHLTSAGLFSATGDATLAPEVPLISILTHPLVGLTEKLPPRTSVRLVLTKAPDAALLLGGPGAATTMKTIAPDTSTYMYKFEIKKMVLFCRQYQMLDKVYISDKQKMESMPAKFFYYRPQSSWVNIPQGTNYCTHTLFRESDQVSKAWFCFFDQKRLTGDETKALGYFEKPSDLESLDITIGVSTLKYPVL